jgi:hypothetical protein
MDRDWVSSLEVGEMGGVVAGQAETFLGVLWRRRGGD